MRQLEEVTGSGLSPAIDRHHILPVTTNSDPDVGAEPPPQRITPESLCDPEWVDWYRLTPAERWRASSDLWITFRALGGSLDPEPDSQSPFHAPRALGAGTPDGRPGVRVVRRSGV